MIKLRDILGSEEFRLFMESRSGQQLMYDDPEEYERMYGEDGGRTPADDIQDWLDFVDWLPVRDADEEEGKDLALRREETAAILLEILEVERRHESNNSLHETVE